MCIYIYICIYTSMYVCMHIYTLYCGWTSSMLIRVEVKRWKAKLAHVTSLKSFLRGHFLNTTESESLQRTCYTPTYSHMSGERCVLCIYIYIYIHIHTYTYSPPGSNHFLRRYLESARNIWHWNDSLFLCIPGIVSVAQAIYVLGISHNRKYIYIHIHIHICIIYIYWETMWLCSARELKCNLGTITRKHQKKGSSPRWPSPRTCVTCVYIKA